MATPKQMPAALRDVCGVQASEDSVIQGILTKTINNSAYSNFLNRPILQRVVTQYYIDKSPILYLWGKQIVEHAGFPELHVELRNSFTIVDRANYEWTADRSIHPRGYLFIRFTNQQYYDSLDLQPDGISPRVRVRYLTNSNAFGDLSDDFKMYLFLETRFQYDAMHNRQPILDRVRLSRLNNKFRYVRNIWYPTT